MKKTVYKNPLLGEYTLATLDNGLKIYIMEKKDFGSVYAAFGTRYGSIDTRFSRNDGPEITVPEGIAHFLEHKLFESEDGDAFSRFAETGAYCNAYTSFDRTCYIFSCSANFEKNLEILLDFVQSPYFTAETVKKEQGIIGQEIKMYEDSPGWRVMFNLLKQMYENHPVKIDIAGTVESIAEITAEKLYDVYNVFYNLNNMVLCVSGNVTVEQVLKTADKMLKPCEN
ncbi:MAG: pitrilysin family protein, partial [Acutalibacteraceae bacterium]|nr:pitrilysin family protein [Acutalibacteraceae bacterium]